MSLEKACYKADVDAARAVLAGGAPVTFEALQNAVSFGTKGEAKRRQVIVRLLLDAGADPNMPAPPGLASIMNVAAGSVSADILQMLIAAGGRVKSGCLLHAAVGWNQPENIRLLLAAGADPNEPLTGERLEPTEPIVGMTPLQYARHLKHKKCVAALTEGTAGGKPGA
jgi:hypothetical protein